jgi:TfoX/Sxy family transcriptional regulator of competence genes
MDDEELLAHVRQSLAGTRSVKEIKMFGGIGFMLNGNLLVAASNRGLLVRVGKDAEREALSRPGASPMVMRGRAMGGYIRLHNTALNKRAVASWVRLARAFVSTLAKKPAKKPPAKKPNKAKSSR